MTKEQKRVLEQQLWNISNTLRGKMNADEFRDYILGFIFYKYLSDKMASYANDILETENVVYDELDALNTEHQAFLTAIKEEAIEKLGYFLKPEELFSEIASRSQDKEGHDNFILDELKSILNNIEQSTMGQGSEDDFDGLFEDLDLTSSKLGKTEADKNALISKILVNLDKIDFDVDNAKSDVLGDAYEYMIGQFASGAGKGAGEFYTPQQVSTILAKIVSQDKKRLKSVYDPSCGSGSLLLRVSKEVDDVDTFYGQELNITTYNLARMNMILHDVHYNRFDIKQEDTLEKPQHLEHRFDAIVANPPFSANWSANPLHLTDERFSDYGKLAPASKADFAFIQHMAHQLDDDGTMAVVLPHGVLFRGAAEGIIRKHLIQNLNYIHAVIGLPENIFYGTSIATCILVLKKNREVNEGILFVDASKQCEKDGTKNALRENNIDAILSGYIHRGEMDKFSHVASLEELEENDFNLNIPRYVDTFEAEAPIDLTAVAGELKALNLEIIDNDQVIAGFCRQLAISGPF